MEVKITETPESAVAPAPITISKNKRANLGVSLYNSIDGALADRSQLDLNLDYYNKMYEMEVGQRDFPWPNAANVFVPLIPTQVDTLAARLTATVFPPRLFLVNGNTDAAAQFQHEVERYYNAELARHGWTEKFYQGMHLGLRDGTAIMEVLWKKVTRKRKVVQATPLLDDETGSPVPDPENPDQPAMTTQVVEVDFEEFNDVELAPVELRDFLLMPAWQTSIEDATAVARKLYLDEPTLRAMVKAGVLYKDAVEQALEMTTVGQSEMPEDRQGVSSYELAGNINVAVEEGSPTSDDNRMKGPLIVWRVHSRQYDLDGDGVPEENVFWVHDRSQLLLGHGVYEYWHGKRPFEALAPIPRLNRFYGFSVCERLRPIQEEINAIHNQRLDALTLGITPPIRMDPDIKDDNAKMSWGPANTYYAKEGQIGVVNYTPVTSESYQEEAALNALADKLIGQSGAMTGGMNSGRRSAKEVTASMQSAGVRQDLMAARIRQWLKNIFWQIHHLKLQYGPDNMVSDVGSSGKPERLQLPKAKLAQDYDLSISGMGGPVDKQGRQQSMLFLYSLLMKNPIVAQNPLKSYRVTRMLLEEYDRVDIPTLLGTEEEIIQQMKAQQEQAQQQAQQAAASGQPPPQQGQPPGQPQGQHPPQQPPQHGPNDGPKLAA